jgi:hypothetical protein
VSKTAWQRGWKIKKAQSGGYTIHHPDGSQAFGELKWDSARDAQQHLRSHFKTVPYKPIGPQDRPQPFRPYKETNEPPVAHVVRGGLPTLGRRK